MNAPKLRFKEFNDDWKKINLKSVFNYYSTNSLSREQLSNSGIIKNIHYGDIHRKFSTIVDINRHVDSFIKDLNYKNKNELCKNYDLIFADASEDYEGIGKAIELINVDFNTVSGLHTILARDVQNSFAPKFKGYYFNSPIIHNQIRVLANGFKVYGISKETINKLNVNIPSKNEQTKIANTLELLDKKIELQSKKIEDLKLFKKGLSANIFNSLRNFEKYKLGKICNITTGKLDANAMIDNGKYRFYTCAKEYSLIDKYAFDTEALLISGNGAYVGYIHYYKGRFNAYQRTYVLDDFSQNIQFIKCYLEENLAKRINSEKKEGNTPYIVLSTLSDMVIKIPSKENQIKISNIINCHNKKIELEENKLLKLQELKKGLMQSMFV